MAASLSMLEQNMESTGDERVMVDAGRLLKRSTDRATAVRVAAASKGATHVVHALMKEDTGLSPDDPAKVGAEKIRAAAWWVWARGYHRGQYNWCGPLKLTPASLERCFVSMPVLYRREQEPM